MKIQKTILRGNVTPPPSKSITHRAFILSSLATKSSLVKNPLRGQDTNSTLSVLNKCGSRYTELENSITMNSPINKGNGDLNCGNSGTTLRLMTGITSLFPETSLLYGDDSLNQRPIGILGNAISQFDVKVEYKDNTPPIKIKGPPTRKEVSIEIPGNISSQYLSAIALLAAFRSSDQSTYMQITSNLVSKPYFDLTLQMLEKCGIHVSRENQLYIIEGNSTILNYNLEVPMDFSSAAFYLAAGALNDNKIKVRGVFSDLKQADRKLIDFLQEMGSKITSNKDSILVEGSNLDGIEADLQSCPDLFPIMCVLGTQAKGETLLYGAKHLKFKESNRIDEMTRVLKLLKCDITPTDEGAIIRRSDPHGGIGLTTGDDHRIAMATAILGTVSVKPIIIQDAESIPISYPNFEGDLKSISLGETLE